MESLIRANTRKCKYDQVILHVSTWPLYQLHTHTRLSLWTLTKWTSHCNSSPCCPSSPSKTLKSAKITPWDNKLFLLNIVLNYSSSYLVSDLQQSKCPDCHTSRKPEQIATFHTQSNFILDIQLMDHHEFDLLHIYNISYMQMRNQSDR